MSQSPWLVGPESLRMLELGHPWIIADRYTKTWPKGQVGQLIELTDAGGRFLATALLDPEERIVARVLGRERVHLDRGCRRRSRCGGTMVIWRGLLPSVW
jgi:23S rRNA (cytosine1962-C5)-methyltransferase